MSGLIKVGATIGAVFCVQCFLASSGLAEGPAGLRSVEITAYVAAGADEDVITRLWHETMARCPVTTSLSDSTTVQASLRLS